MDQPTLVGKRTVRADKDVAGNGLLENLDTKDVCDDFLCFTLNVRMHQRNVVVAAYDVAQGRQPFLDSLDLHTIRKTVSQVEQLLVSGLRRNQKPPSVTCRHPAHYSCAGNRCVDDWNDVSQLGLEGRVEVFRPANGNQGVGVGEFGKHTNLVGILKLCSSSHLVCLLFAVWLVGTRNKTLTTQWLALDDLDFFIQANFFFFTVQGKRNHKLPSRLIFLPATAVAADKVKGLLAFTGSRMPASCEMEGTEGFPDTGWPEGR